MLYARDELVNSILEEEDELIAAHRKQIEDTMTIVRLEMNLLGEVRAVTLTVINLIWAWANAELMWLDMHLLGEMRACLQSHIALVNQSR